MILTFSKQQFVDRIISGVKIHTIREDKTDRWKEGTKIHFWKGNPRNVKLKPYPFGESICTKVVDIRIDLWRDSVYADDHFLNLKELAVNDGFNNWVEMKSWFRQQGFEFFFEGKLIYFDKP